MGELLRKLHSRRQTGRCGRWTVPPAPLSSGYCLSLLSLAVTPTLSCCAPGSVAFKHFFPGGAPARLRVSLRRLVEENPACRASVFLGWASDRVLIAYARRRDGYALQFWSFRLAMQRPPHSPCVRLLSETALFVRCGVPADAELHLYIWQSPCARGLLVIGLAPRTHFSASAVSPSEQRRCFATFTVPPVADDLETGSSDRCDRCRLRSPARTLFTRAPAARYLVADPLRRRSCRSPRAEPRRARRARLSTSPSPRRQWRRSWCRRCCRSCRTAASW